MPAIPTTGQLLPFWGRVTLIESPVDETELDSGLVLPSKFEGDGGVKRGVVLDVDAACQERFGSYEIGGRLPAGTIVFYREGVRLPGGVVVVWLSDILAYEAS